MRSAKESFCVGWRQDSGLGDVASLHGRIFDFIHSSLWVLFLLSYNYFHSLIEAFFIRVDHERQITNFVLEFLGLPL